MKQINEELNAEIARLYGGGKSVRVIAAEVGRSYGYVHQVLTEARVTFRPRGGHRKAAAASQ